VKSSLRDPARNRYLLVSLVVLALDQASKWLVQERLPLHRSVDLFPGLSFTHVENTGVAFGLFAARGELFGTVLLTVFGLVALALVLVYFQRTPSDERRTLVALALILGGAVGNLIDRIAQGAVTDFIDVWVGTYHWHTFNIADSAISVGICLLALDLFLGRHSEENDSDAPAALRGD
jgi:signal peptidase II